MSDTEALDADFREELAAIESLLARPHLWRPIEDATVPYYDARPTFERRRDELAGKLSVTKVTTLTGYALYSSPNPSEGHVLGMPTGDAPAVTLEDLCPPLERERPYDLEISIRIKPHVATRKETAE